MFMPMMSNDKMLHFAISMFLTVALSGRLGIVNAAIATLAIGMVKEVLDGFGFGDPEVRDLMWDMAGIIAGSIIMVITQYLNCIITK